MAPRIGAFGGDSYLVAGTDGVGTKLKLLCNKPLGVDLVEKTAGMRDFYAATEYDLSGFAIGIVKKDSVINGKNILVGDIWCNNATYNNRLTQPQKSSQKVRTATWRCYTRSTTERSLSLGPVARKFWFPADIHLSIKIVFHDITRTRGTHGLKEGLKEIIWVNNDTLASNTPGSSSKPQGILVMEQRPDYTNVLFQDEGYNCYSMLKYIQRLD
ncbi:hypothetical protein WN944_010667 [Citrus x changshan-huyou]|uniref:Uncharacterized protein n=1 Tax=Citrus x changshan-huyou TaxID=2935761 RepID=A0AAP0MS31_9ROSI